MTIKNKIQALILVGGKSSRMQTDKSTLSYHGVDQAKYLYNLLVTKVDKVFFSIREEQEELSHLLSYPRIKDEYDSVGPICGILSAFDNDNNSGWLVMAIDLPHADEESIDQLLAAYDPKKIATCFINPEKKWAEPLFTIYSPKARPKLIEYFAEDKKCPRKFLRDKDITIIDPKNNLALINANTPEEYRKAVDQLKGQKCE